MLYRALDCRFLRERLCTLFALFVKIAGNRPFPSCFEPHYESEAKCKFFVLIISFHSYANKTNFNMKSLALSLAFIVRFTATRKWPISVARANNYFSFAHNYIWMQIVKRTKALKCVRRNIG